MKTEIESIYSLVSSMTLAGFCALLIAAGFVLFSLTVKVTVTRFNDYAWIEARGGESRYCFSPGQTPKVLCGNWTSSPEAQYDFGEE